jgi:peptide/nickel transport system permease protein
MDEPGAGRGESSAAAVTADQPLPLPTAPALPPAGGDVSRLRGTWRLFVSVFIQNRLAVAGLAIIVVMVLFSFVGPYFYHTNQVQTNLALADLPPSSRHPLGTDDVGYDVLGRLMLGGQSSLEVGVAAALLSSLLGTVWGAAAGVAGGWVDAVLMRVVDAIMAVPFLLLALLLANIFTPTVPVLIVVISLISWLSTARLVRGSTLSLRVRDYVLAAKVAGAGSSRIIIRHIFPNVMGTVVVQTTFSVADAILLLAVMSYLGLGPPPPAADWGGMLTNGLNYVYDGYWWLIYPAGLCIVLLVTAFNFIGDALRDAFEVRLQRR